MALRIPASLVRAALVFLLLTAQTSFAAIWLASLDGTCLDEHGKPLAGVVLHFTDPANGKHFQLITGGDGKFFYIAVQPAIYTVQVVRKGKAPAIFENVDIEWSSQPLLLEINLERNAVKVTRTTVLQEFFPQEQLQASLPVQGNADQATVAAINQQLATARQLSDAGDWQGAIRALWNAIEIDPNRDLPWALLAVAQCHAAAHYSADGGRSQLDDCVRSYEKALAIAQVAAYRNNLGNAYVKLGRYDDAIQQYRQAELLNPDQSALYQQNIGLALVEEAQALPNNSAIELLQRALEAFNRVSPVDAKNAEVSYWKGICQLRLAANGLGSYKDVITSFQNYLKLASGGRFAAEVEGMLKALEKEISN